MYLFILLLVTLWKFYTREPFSKLKKSHSDLIKSNKIIRASMIKPKTVQKADKSKFKKSHSAIVKSIQIIRKSMLKPKKFKKAEISKDKIIVYNKPLLFS